MIVNTVDLEVYANLISGEMNKMSEVSVKLNEDKESRNRIVAEIDTNFFVEAGAGSGKTTMLVNRMVSMIEHGTDISKICAITFTKAAAGEFYERFQNKLTERSSPEYKYSDTGRAGQLGKPTPATMKLCAEALKNIDLCFMGTIDSFCNMILSEHPTEAGIPSDSQIISEPDAAVIYKQLYVQISEGKYGKELAELARTFRSFYRDPEEVFAAGIKVFMDNRNVDFHISEKSPVDIDDAFRNKRNTLLCALKFLKDHKELQYSNQKDSVASWERIENDFNTLNRKWSRNYSGVMYALKSVMKLRLIPEAGGCGNVITDVFVPGGKQGKWLNLDSSFTEELMDDLDDIRYSVSTAFLSESVPVIEKHMREKGKLSYFDYLFYLRNMLKKDAEGDGKLIRYTYNRHSYFLIDEFQDTNPMQAEVFFYISAEHPVPEWRKCVPRPGSLFIVGDPKQSIYRFRSADVTSFLRVRKLFETGVGDVLKLSANFRSCTRLKKYFNKTFTEMLPSENKYQSKFNEIPIDDAPFAEDLFEGVYKYEAVSGEKAEAENPEQTDPVIIGKIISAITGNEKYKIKTPKDNEPRCIKYSDIMIITSAKAKLPGIMSELDRLNVPVRVEGSVPFTGNEALAATGDIYRAIADTEMNCSLYPVLTGKLFGFTDEDLINFRNSGGRISLKGDSVDFESAGEKTKQIKTVLDALRDLQITALRESPSVVFKTIMDKFKIFERISTDNLEVLYYVLELIRSAENSGGIVSVPDGAAFIDMLLNGDSDLERCLSFDDNRNCVHMANLHKVKGLEAPVVILASAGKKKNYRYDFRVEHNDDETRGYLFGLAGKGFNTTHFKTSAYEDKSEEEKEAYIEEEKRLVYVAATRAAGALIIGNSTSSKWADLFEGCTDILTRIEESENAASANDECESATELYEKAESSSVLSDRSNEAETYRTEKPSGLVLSKISENEEDDQAENSLVTEEVKETVPPVHWFPDELGTMIHRLLEMMVTAGASADTEKIISEILNEYLSEKTKPFEKEFRKALAGAAEKIRNGGYPQKNSVPEDIFTELQSAEERYTEVPFCYKDDITDVPTIWNGIMDVVYKKAGEWHIIDYKTNFGDQDYDEVYSAQLKAYTDAFEKITGEKVKDAHTYHITV